MATNNILLKSASQMCFHYQQPARQGKVATWEGCEAPECVVLLSGGSARSEDSVESHERPVCI